MGVAMAIPEAARSGTPGPSQHLLDPDRPQFFAAALAALRAAHLAAPDSRHAGAVELIGFEPLKERYGKRWTLVEGKVGAVAHACLERGLGTDDRFLPIDEALFAVLFPRLDRQAAAIRARLIASDMAARLCGASPGGGCVRIRPLQQRLADLLADDLDARALIGRIREADQPPETAPDWRRIDEVLQLRHWPVLHLGKRLVPIYRAVPTARAGIDAEAAATAMGDDPETRTARDLWALHGAAGVLPTLAGRGRKAVLMIPLHYATIAHLGPRAPYLGICRRLPAASSRRLLFLLEGLPDGLPRTRVRELLMGLLKPFALGIVVRAGPEPAGLDRLASCGVVGLALDAATAGGGDKGDQRLAAFAAAARAHGLAGFLLDIASLPQARAARHAGFDYLQGAAVLGPAEAPGRVVALAGR